MMNGMGGDLFAIEWDAKTEALAGLNSSGWAPEKLTPEFLKQKGITSMPSHGNLFRHGAGLRARVGSTARKIRAPALGRSFPARSLLRAQNGFPVAEIIAG